MCKQNQNRDLTLHHSKTALELLECCEEKATHTMVGELPLSWFRKFLRNVFNTASFFQNQFGVRYVAAGRSQILMESLRRSTEFDKRSRILLGTFDLTGRPMGTLVPSLHIARVRRFVMNARKYLTRVCRGRVSSPHREIATAGSRCSEVGTPCSYDSLFGVLRPCTSQLGELSMGPRAARVPLSGIGFLTVLALTYSGIMAACGGNSVGGTGSSDDDLGAASDVDTPADAIGGADPAEFVKTVSVTITSPLPQSAFLIGSEVKFVGSVFRKNNPLTNVDVSWDLFGYGTFGGGTTGENGESSATLTDLGAGLQTVQLVARFSDEVTSDATITIRGVGVPTAPSVKITPQAPTAVSGLTAEIVEPSTAEGASEITYEYQWYRNGEPITTGIYSVLSPGNAFRDDRVTVVVTPNAHGMLGPVGQDSVVLGNTPPVMKGAFIQPKSGSTLTSFECVGEAWGDVDGDLPVDTYHWQLNGEQLLEHTSPILAPKTAQRGDVIRCGITPGDGTDAGETHWSGEVIVGNAAPWVDSVNVGPDGGGVVSIFVCDAQKTEDADNDPVSLQYQWLRNGSLVDVAKATVAGVLFTKGDELACGVTPNDGIENGQTIWSETIQIANSAPTGAQPIVYPIEASALDVLKCSVSPAVDPDGDTATYNIAWYIGDQLVLGQTSPELPAGIHKRGDAVVCGATPTDGQTFGEELRSDPVYIGNASPKISNIAIEPTGPTIESTLICAAHDVTDADSDFVTIGYSWLINTKVVQGANESVLKKGYKKGDEVSCTATPHDGFSFGTPISAPPVEILNAKPTGGATTISPTTPNVTNVLKCDVVGVSDPDGDPMTYDIVWWVNGVPVTESSSTETLSAPVFASGDVVRCAATANDGKLSGEPLLSPEIVIANAPPMGGIATIQPPMPTAAATLVCDVSAINDPDGDDITWTYEWIKNGEKISGAFFQSLPPGNVSKNDILVCLAVPSDGKADGAVVVSQSVVIQNSPPTGGSTLLSPPTASVLTTLTCLGAGATDADDEQLTYLFGWKVNGVPLAGTSGAKLKAPQFTKGDSVTCWSLATDGVVQGPASESNEVIIGNAAPDSPVVNLTPTSPTTESNLHCGATAGGDPDGDPITYSYSWLLDGVVVPNETGQYFGGGTANKGQTVQCAVTSSDGSAISGISLSNQIVIGNASPEGGKVAVTPQNPSVLSTLNCVGTDAIDPDGDDVVWTYIWMVNGTQTAAGQSMSAAPLSKGDTVVCIGTPSDGISQGSPVSGQPLVILNAAPKSGTASVLPTVATVTSKLSCVLENFSDPDSDVLTPTITWYVNGKDTPAQTNNILSAPAFAKNDVVHCTAKVSDGFADSATISSPQISVGNAPPGAAAVTLTPVTATVTTTLVCNASGASDPDGDLIDYEYAWKVGGVIVAGKSDQTLGAPDFTSGSVVVCSARSTDGELTGPWIPSSAVVIKNAPPTGGQVDLGPADAKEDDVLKCSVSDAVDPDGDSISYIIEWWVNGKIVPVTGETLDGKWFDAGDTVTCVAIPTDGSASGAPIEADTPIAVQNTKPTIQAAKLTPLEGNKQTTFTCTPQGWNDPDKDPESYVYLWHVNNVVQPEATTANFGTSKLIPGDIIHCDVTPFDGMAFGVSVKSNSVVVINNPPSILTASILPDNPTTLSELDCLPKGWADVDLDLPGYLYQWLIDGKEVVGATTSTLPAGTATKGKSVVCVVIPDDGYDTGLPVQSQPVVIANAPPSLGLATLSPAYGNQSTLFTCTAVAPNDPDGDQTTLTYAWYVNGKKYFGAAEPTLKGVQFTGLSVLTCEVTPKDGMLAGMPVASNVAELWNTPPSIESTSLTPFEPSTTDALTCEVIGWADAEGDPEKSAYAWLKNGVLIPGLVSNMLPESATLKNQVWQCQATPFDGLAYGTSKLSAPVTIKNTAPIVAKVTVGPTNATALSTLTCLTTGWVDPDNDPQQYTYTWLKNGEMIGGQTASILPAGNTKMGDVVQCTATPYDGSAFGTAVLSSNSLTIQNAPPQITVKSPTSLQYGTGDTVLFSATVKDTEDQPKTIFVEWKSSLLGDPLYAAYATTEGLSEFSDDLLGVGQHVVQVTATDTMGAKTIVEVPLVIGLICGSTGNSVPSDPVSMWTSGDFETGTLHPWSYANYRFLTTNGGMLDTDVCDIDEYAIGSSGAKDSKYGLTLSPIQNEFLLVKSFGTPVNKASVEGWVWLAGGFGLKFGFVSAAVPNKPGAFLTSGFANTITTTTTYVYSGTSTSSKNNNGTPGAWVKIRFSRDVTGGTFSYYVNDILQFTVGSIAQTTVTGFAVGVYDATSSVVEAKLDGFSYIVEPK